MHMVPHECKEGMTVYLLGTDRKGKVLFNNGGEAANGWPMAMVEWSDGTVQKVTIRSLQSEANYLASKPAPASAQTVDSLIKEKLEEKAQKGGLLGTGDKVYLRPVPPNTVRSLTEFDSGEVLASVPGKDGMLLVEWKRGRIEKVMANTLMGEKEAQQLSQSLEEEFEKVEEAILKKMTKAAALIREANALAEEAGLVLYELDDGGLLNAMQDVGWRTSSMRC